MASFIFESGSQTDANAFATGDTLVFQNATANSLSVAYVAATAGSPGVAGTPDYFTITSTVNGATKSLNFTTSSISYNNNLLLLTTGGKLVVGTEAGESTAGAGTYTGNDNLFASLTKSNVVFALGSSAATTNPVAAAGIDSVGVSGTGAHVIYGGGGIDSILVATNGSDTALSGNYILNGGDGADSILAGAATGNLRIYGNALSTQAGTNDGNDTIVVGLGTNYVNGNAGDDSITVVSQAGTGVNHLEGGNGADVITGGGGIDSIYGTKGNDVLDGGNGNDYIRGGADADRLIGGQGNDQLSGDGGADTITGGIGVDVMWGGNRDGGARSATDVDTFVFGAGDASIQSASITANTTVNPDFGYFDEIKDFRGGTDKIDLSSVGTTANAGAAVSVKLVVGSANIIANTEADARVYAQQLLDNNASTATTHTVVQVQVGSDSYLYSAESNNPFAAGGTIDSIVKLDGVTYTANILKAADII